MIAGVIVEFVSSSRQWESIIIESVVASLAFCWTISGILSPVDSNATTANTATPATLILTAYSFMRRNVSHGHEF